MKKLIVIGGATATGKTALSIRLAQHFRTEILSADSRQFYREMSIGTAKPSPAELAAAPHHFIDILSVAEDYSVGDFERDALAILQGIFIEKDVAILVGGSGLYLRAVYEGLDKFPEISPETKKHLEEAEKSGGLQWLQRELAERDPLQFSKIDQQNPARLRRALEVCLETGQPYSSFLQQSERNPRTFQPIYILLDLPRPELYARIESRVDAMIAAGLEEEARGLLQYRNRPPLSTVGYEEFFDFFDGELSRDKAIDKIKQHSRNYAKRQVTWFAKHGDWKVFRPEEEAEILEFVKLRVT
ncbi:MAG: tRNA (adenosine(37)-N6)-dimethylallyltransferase MiaA [Saprospiraceae bacterium]|nr:tRNA (adenosine(37)-N6)-dimethylallyltransferase MiaA [Saprospiraceae bacterium]